MTKPNEGKEILFGSLSLLDDAAALDSLQRVDQFTSLDDAIEESLRAIRTELLDAVAEEAVAEEIANMETASDTQTHTQHVVSADPLGKRSSFQKTQNETLLKALQDLRTKMQETKLKSGKVVNKET